MTPDEHIVTALLTALKRAEQIASAYLDELGPYDQDVYVRRVRSDVQAIRKTIAEAEK